MAIETKRRQRKLQDRVDEVMKHSIEWSISRGGFVSFALDLDDFDRILNDFPDEISLVYLAAFDDMTTSLIDDCGFEGVVTGDDEIALLETTAAALEREAARLRAAIKREKTHAK